jgi:hypothetical protein
MAGMLVINVPATFATCLLMGSGPRTKYGTTEQDTTSTGLLRWECQAAVTYVAEPGMRAQSEVLSITVAAPADPAASLTPGTPVEFTDLRAGVSTPEAREGGKGVRGGRLFWSASGVRPANGHRPGPKAAE